MILSTFGCCGSVKSKNLVPVKVEKHWRRKFSVSRTSMPEGASGRVVGGLEEAGFADEVVEVWERG